MSTGVSPHYEVNRACAEYAQNEAKPQLENKKNAENLSGIFGLEMLKSCIYINAGGIVALPVIVRSFKIDIMNASQFTFEAKLVFASFILLVIGVILAFLGFVYAYLTCSNIGKADSHTIQAKMIQARIAFDLSSAQPEVNDIFLGHIKSHTEHKDKSEKYRSRTVKSAMASVSLFIVSSAISAYVVLIYAKSASFP